MPYDVKKSQKYLARELRRKGFSYGEIQKELAVPKSTLSLWLKRIKLDEAKQVRLQEKRASVARENVQKRILKRKQEIFEIQEQAFKAIKKISKRELWLLGLMLYWKSTQGKQRKIVELTSSNPSHVKLFLRWLQEIGGLENNELAFTIYMKHAEGEKEKSIAYWSRITELPKKYFLHYYYMYTKKKEGEERRKRSYAQSSAFGLLKITVKASSLLSAQISAWIKSIEHELI